MAAITTLRATIATALASSTWSTYSFPPATIPANSVCVIPSDPWITPSNNARTTVAPLVNFRLALAVPLLDNAGNLTGIENMVVSVFNKLSTSGLIYNVTAVSAPIVLSVASGDLLSCDLSIAILTSWS